MNSILTLSGVCDKIVYRWLVEALYHHGIHIKHLEDYQDGLVIQTTGQQDDMYDLYTNLKEKITEAEADLKLELTSY